MRLVDDAQARFHVQVTGDALGAVEGALVTGGDEKHEPLDAVVGGRDNVGHAPLVDLPPVAREGAFAQEDAVGAALGHLRDVHVAAIGEVGLPPRGAGRVGLG